MLKAKDIIPIPVFRPGMKLLALQPHPDDLELFTGGTIAKMIASGSEVIILTVTFGGYGTLDPNLIPAKLIQIREAEARKAAAILGVKETLFLEYIDSEQVELKPLRNQLIKLIRIHKPHGFFIPDPWLPYEAHQGHVVCGLAAAEAALFSSLTNLEPLFPAHTLEFVALYATHKPNTFIDVSEYWDTKMQALKCHKSQFSEEQFFLLENYLSIKAKEYGSLINTEKAEAYKVLTTLHLHANVDSWES